MFRYKILGCVCLFICVATMWILSSFYRPFIKFNNPTSLETETSPDYEMFPSGDPQHQCNEKRHLVYIKVPKTGSSTISTIIWQFGMQRNLTFAVERNKGPMGCRFMTPNADGEHCDLLAHHVTYNFKTIKNVFPNDTLIIASVREPFDVFISGLYFCHLLPTSPLTEIEKITMLINKTYNAFQSTPPSDRIGSHLYQRMSARLGVPLSKAHDVNFIKHHINTDLDRHLDLVLIREYFDESLVLMKRRLCWNLADIIYLSHKVQNYTSFDFTSEILSMHRNLSISEYLVYDHFYSKFWMMVRHEGFDFFDEVRAFKYINFRFFSFCNTKHVRHQKLSIPPTKWSAAFEVNYTRCTDMHKDFPIRVKDDILKNVAKF